MIEFPISVKSISFSTRSEVDTLNQNMINPWVGKKLILFRKSLWSFWDLFDGAKITYICYLLFIHLISREERFYLSCSVAASLALLEMKELDKECAARWLGSL